MKPDRPKSAKRVFPAFRCLYQTYFFLIGILFLTLSGYVITQYQTSFTLLNQIIENWSKDVVIDADVGTVDGCPPKKGLESEIIGYNLPATYPACDCRSIRRMLIRTKSKTVTDNVMYVGAGCSDDQLQEGCKQIDSFKGQTMNFWSNGIELARFKICLYRLPGHSTVNNTKKYHKDKFKCPTGEQLCGGTFCVPDQQPCPITELKMVPTYAGTRIDSEVYTQPETIQYGEGILLSLDSRMSLQLIRGQANPIVEVLIAEGDGVCEDITQLGSTSGRQDYPLMKEEKRYCLTRDPEFTQLHAIDEYTFYKVNQLDGLPLQLPGFEISKQYVWSKGIYYRNAIKFDPKCYGDYFDDIMANDDSLKFIESCLMAQFVVNLVFFFSISIVLTIISCANIHGYDWPCIKGRDTEESNYIFKCEVIVKTLIQLTQIISIIVGTFSIRSQIHLMDSVVDGQCTTEFRDVQTIFQDIQRTLWDGVYQFNLIMMGFVMMTLLMDLTIVCVMLYRWKKRGSKNEVQVHPYPEDLTFSQIQAPPGQGTIASFAGKRNSTQPNPRHRQSSLQVSRIPLRPPIITRQPYNQFLSVQEKPSSQSSESERSQDAEPQPRKSISNNNRTRSIAEAESKNLLELSQQLNN